MLRKRPENEGPVLALSAASSVTPRNSIIPKTDSAKLTAVTTPAKASTEIKALAVLIPPFAPMPPAHKRHSPNIGNRVYRARRAPPPAELALASAVTLFKSGQVGFKDDSFNECNQNPLFLLGQQRISWGKIDLYQKMIDRIYAQANYTVHQQLSCTISSLALIGAQLSKRSKDNLVKQINNCILPAIIAQKEGCIRSATNISWGCSVLSITLPDDTLRKLLTAVKCGVTEQLYGKELEERKHYRNELSRARLVLAYNQNQLSKMYKQPSEFLYLERELKAMDSALIKVNDEIACKENRKVIESKSQTIFAKLVRNFNPNFNEEFYIAGRQVDIHFLNKQRSEDRKNNLVIEWDGPHHDDRKAIDKFHDTILVRLGFDVRRVSYKEFDPLTRPVISNEKQQQIVNNILVELHIKQVRQARLPTLSPHSPIAKSAATASAIKHATNSPTVKTPPIKSPMVKVSDVKSHNSPIANDSIKEGSTTRPTPAICNLRVAIPTLVQNRVMMFQKSQGETPSSSASGTPSYQNRTPTSK